MSKGKREGGRRASKMERNLGRGKKNLPSMADWVKKDGLMGLLSFKVFPWLMQIPISTVSPVNFCVRWMPRGAFTVHW